VVVRVNQIIRYSCTSSTNQIIPSSFAAPRCFFGIGWFTWRRELRLDMWRSSCAITNLLHDGDGDVESSKRLTEKALRHLSRHCRLGLVMVEEEERLVGLDELVHVGNLPHRALNKSIRHAAHGIYRSITGMVCAHL
jgi:hypothetical protein